MMVKEHDKQPLENSNLDGNGGGVLPPSVEDYRRMYEWKAKQLKEVEYERISEKNRREAIRQIFKENVERQVAVRDPRLKKAFFSNIDVVEK